jgi:hypothetical protein
MKFKVKVLDYSRSFRIEPSQNRAQIIQPFRENMQRSKFSNENIFNLNIIFHIYIFFLVYSLDYLNRFYSFAPVRNHVYAKWFIRAKVSKLMTY